MNVSDEFLKAAEVEAATPITVGAGRRGVVSDEQLKELVEAWAVVESAHEAAQETGRCWGRYSALKIAYRNRTKDGAFAAVAAELLRLRAKVRASEAAKAERVRVLEDWLERVHFVLVNPGTEYEAAIEGALGAIENALAGTTPPVRAKAALAATPAPGE